MERNQLEMVPNKCNEIYKSVSVEQLPYRPLVATLLGLMLSNLGIIPSNAPEYGVVNSFLLPLAIPLVLLSADLR